MATDYLNEDENGLPPSKSQLKRDSEALQDLGRELTELPAGKLKKMELDEQLLVAVLDYQRFTANGAKRRQMQYIGKLMRGIDPEPIEEKLAALRGDASAHTNWLHLLERWRERMLEDDKNVQQFINEFSEVDVQQLRTTVRNARKERAEDKAPKAARQLFQMIKDLIPQQGKQKNTPDGDFDDEGEQA